MGYKIFHTRIVLAKDGLKFTLHWQMLSCKNISFCIGKGWA